MRVLGTCQRDEEGCLSQNDKGSSKYNDDLAQYATWHFKLNAKKLEWMNKNWQVAAFSKFITGKHGFFNGGKTEKNLIHFLARKVDQYWPRVYKKMQNSNIWGGMFPKKS